MTKQEIARIFMLLKVAFPSFIPSDREEAEAKVTLWSRMFERTSYSEAEWAAMRCIESCTFPPTVADMKSYLGMGRTLDDVRAALPFKEDKPVYANEAYMQAVYDRIMKELEGE